MQYFRGIDTAYNIKNTVFALDRYWLFYAMHSIFVGSTLFILRNIQYFLRSIRLYWAIRSIFRGWVLLILNTTQKFRGIDTVNTRQCANIYVGSILLILNTTLNPRLGSAYTQHYAEISGHGYCLYLAKRSIFRRSILLILSNIKYVRGVDTSYNQQYSVFSNASYCFY